MELHRINQEIFEMEGNLRKRKKLESSSFMLQQSIDEKRKEIEVLRLQTDEEKKDVEKLAALSPTNAFLFLFGKRGERLSKEKKEYLAMQLELKEAEKGLQSLKEEHHSNRQQIRELDRLLESYPSLMLEKKGLLQLLSNGKDSELEKYLEMSRQIRLNMKDTDEAIHEGGRVLSIITSREEALYNLKTWGLLDPTGENKHESNALTIQCQAFIRELSDLQKYDSYPMDVESVVNNIAIFQEQDHITNLQSEGLEKMLEKLGFLKKHIQNQLEILELCRLDLKSRYDTLEEKINLLLNNKRSEENHI